MKMHILIFAEQPNNESLTSLFRIRNGTQPLTENMVGSTLKIKNAYVKEIQVSNINTPSYEFGGTYGQDMGMEVEPTDDVLDTQVYITTNELELIITHRPRSFTELEHCHYITCNKIVLNKVIMQNLLERVGMVEYVENL